MNTFYLKYFLLAFVILVLFSSCLVEPKFPAEPKITYKSFDTIFHGTIDSLAVSFKYRDGDGDIGLNQEEGEKFRPYTYFINSAGQRDSIANPNFFNIFVDILVLNEEGEYEPIQIPDGLVLHVRLPRLHNDEKPKPIEGDMTFYKEITTGLKRYISGKTIKVKVFIKDRALNESNVIETDSITLPLL